MFPYGDEPVPAATRFPFFTISLILINIAVFVYQIYLGTNGGSELVQDWGFTPDEFWAGEQFLTPITSMFMHGGLLHIVSNMIFLAIFGPNVEDQLGRLTYFIFYLAGGLIAALIYGAVFPDLDGPLVGASGAVAAVLGGYVLLFPRAMVRSLLFFGPFVTAGRVAAIILIGFWFVLQLVQSVVSILELAPQQNVAFVAHAAGFVFGVVAVGAIRESRHQPISHWDRGPERWWNRSFRNWLILAVLLTLGLIATQWYVQQDGGLLPAMLQIGVLLLAGLIAIVDGWFRLMGKQGLLGSTQRAGRVVAIIQIIAGVGLIGGVFIT